MVLCAETLLAVDFGGSPAVCSCNYPRGKLNKGIKHNVILKRICLETEVSREAPGRGGADLKYTH